MAYLKIRHSTAYYEKQYRIYSQQYNRQSYVFGANMGAKMSKETFMRYASNPDFRFKSGSQEAKEAILTTRGQAMNLASRFKEGMKAIREKEANGEELTDLQKQMKEINERKLTYKAIRTNTGEAKKLIDLLDSPEAWQTAVGSL